MQARQARTRATRRWKNVAASVKRRATDGDTEQAQTDAGRTAGRGRVSQAEESRLGPGEASPDAEACVMWRDIGRALP